MGKKKKQKQARPVVTDVSAVKNSAGEYVVSRSFSEVVDLLSEGVVEGLVSGDYTYVGKEGQTGYESVEFSPWSATGTNGQSNTELGFLQSIYWNQIPIVDKDGFYNFPSINVQTTKGEPQGTIPELNSDMAVYGSIGQSSSDVLDLSVNRPIGERLYGPEIKSGEESPTDTISAQLKPGVKIDKYAKTYTILNKELKKISVNVKVSALFENIQAGPKTYKKSSYLAKCNRASTGFGDTKARTIEYNIYYRPIFDSRFKPADQSSRIVADQTLTWELAKKETVTGKVDQPYIRSTEIDLTKGSTIDFSDNEGFEGWEIRIVRLTPEPLTSFYKAVTFVDGIVEIYGTKLRYPYSAMTYSQFDARSFTRVHSRAYDTKLIKVKIPNNYNPILKTYGNSNGTASLSFDNPIGIGAGDRTNSTYDSTNKKWSKSNPLTSVEWDGGFATVEGVATAAPLKVWTDNPAWCFYDIITNPRYGLGEFIDETQIDKWSLYEIAKYCDELVPDTYGSLEPRFAINYLITSREEAFKVLNDLTSIFRGIAYYSNGSIFATQDKYKLPSYQFNNSNVVEGDFSYSSSSKRARHSVAIVRYNDKRNLFQPAIEYVEDEESVRRYGINEIETTALGCTSRGQARRFAQWILKSEALETETVSFSVGGDGSYLRPGDVVQIYDNFRSPLKYSGRTNTVIKGSAADVTSTNGVASQQGNKYSNTSNFNTVILDQPLNFTSNKSYKFSILTPTYNTTAGEEDEIRRSQIQTAMFSGADAMPITGNFRSNETGVCTQITFNTGSLFGGTGNAFDFDNYVITGYTNTGVWVRGSTENMVTTEQGYSGGCFSGENLIWSIEPSDKNDTEFISGHYSNYKIINIKEDEDTYAISALAYSVEKYDEIESDVASTISTSQVPAFPTGNSASSSSELTTNTRELGALLNITPGRAYLEGSATDYHSIEIEFSVAAPAVSYIKESSQLQGSPTKKTYFVEFDKQDELNLDYKVALFTERTDIPNHANDAPANLSVQTIKIINPELYKDYIPFIADSINNEAEIFEKENPKRKSVEGTVDGKPKSTSSMITEFLTVPDVTTYYVAVFALSEDGGCSYGMLRKCSTAVASKTQSTTLNTSITKLTSEGNLGISNASDVLNNLDAVEPGFSWEVSDKGTLNSLDDVNDRNNFEVSIPNRNRQYRITLRKKSKNNAPSSTIYLELTGYQSPSENPNFVLTKFYNDPNNLKSLITGNGYGWRNNQVISNWTSLNSNQKLAEGADWFSASGVQTATETLGPNYGFNINSGEINEFPLRVFDIVVEAQDSEGITSAGNEAYANTLYGSATDAESQKTETFQSFGADGHGPSDSSYDIFGAKIESPSGVFFAQKPATRIGLSYDFITPTEAGEKGYPYVASAAVFPNGYLQINLQAALKADGTPTITEDESEIFFNNTAGIIYYYTTGDNRIDYQSGEALALNQAPTFKINPSDANLDHEDNKEGGAVDPITKYVEGQDVGEFPAKAFGGLITLGKYTGNFADGLAGNVHRGYYLFGEDDSVDSFEIPFPNIAQSLVENINLVFGYIDDLHILSAFEEDGETPLFNGTDQGKTPKIYTQKHVNYSNSVLEKDGSFTSLTKEAGVYSNLFVDDPGNSLFLNESSITSAGDSALAFRAWGEIKISQFKALRKGINPNYPREFFRTNNGVEKVVTKNIPNLLMFLPLFETTGQGSSYFILKIEDFLKSVGGDESKVSVVINAHIYSQHESPARHLKTVTTSGPLQASVFTSSAPRNLTFDYAIEEGSLIMKSQIIDHQDYAGAEISITFGILVTNE